MIEVSAYPIFCKKLLFEKTMIKHPRTQEEWAEILKETTLGMVGIGNVLSVTLPLRIYPDPILTKVSTKVRNGEFKTATLALLCEKMHYTMFVNNGIGLSAVQVGELKRIITMKIPETIIEDEKEYDVSRPYNFINPEIRETVAERFAFSEGCLSVPGYYEDRERSNAILLRYQTIHGDVEVHWFEGLEAFVIQHEIDHLDGKLFIDDLSPLKKERVRKKIEKTLRRQ